MRRHLTIAALGSLLCVTAAAQKPGADAQKHTLDTAREIAVHYTSKLPDFICTEQVERTDGTNTTTFKVDRLTIALGYSDQKEKQKLVAMNGTPTQQKLDSLDGILTVGEFGGLLLGVFDPSSAADFQWKSSTNLRKRAAAVYTYKIARANSHYMVGGRTEDGKLVSAPAGYHGEVVVDNQTSRVLRLTASADDIPKDSGILSSSAEVDYDFLNVAGKNYLLPAHSAASMTRGLRHIANTVTFTGYRKFEADSAITFQPAAN